MMEQFPQTTLEPSKDILKSVRSPYFEVALKLLSEELSLKTSSEMPDKEKAMVLGLNILTEVDHQGIENFQVFESKKYPGVALPYVKVSMESLVEKTFPHPTPSQPEKPKTARKSIYVINSGFAFPPAGHPFTPWDITYDRVFGLLPEAIKARQTGQPLPEIYVLGSPNSLWGKVTPEWVEQLKSSGFDAYGKLCAELLQPKFDEELQKAVDPHIILHGMSLGSAVMSETFKNLSDNLKPHIQVLLDNPVLSHFKLQIPSGFLIESILRMAFDSRLKQSMSKEPEFYTTSQTALEAKGILPVNDKDNTALKRQAALADAQNLMNIKQFTSGERTYVRQGMYDPVSISPADLFKLIIYGRYKGSNNRFPLKTSHFINRYRVHKWAKIIGNSLKQPSPSLT